MKLKHNKKRNTAFLYESLVKEATVAILKNDIEKRDKVVEIIKKYFKANSLLREDLDCYRSLYQDHRIDKEMYSKVLKEAKLQRLMIDHNNLFAAQSALIKDINKELEPSVFTNFIPQYKNLATIAQIFSPKISPKDRVILESQIIENLYSAKSIDIEELPPVDNVIYKTFVGKFNEKYNGALLEEQKTLLTYYISSFTDNALELKVFLNEEIGRLKEKLKMATSLNEIATDLDMLTRTNELIETLEQFAHKQIDDKMLLTVMKTQGLVKELYDNGNNS